MKYGELKALVKNYLETDETSFNANIGQFVRNAEEQISRQVQLQFLMQTSTSEIPPDTPYVALPGDFLSPYALFIKGTNGQHQPLMNREQSFMREVYPDPTHRAMPRYYAMFDEDTLMLFPTPDQPYELELNYFYEPVSITAATADPDNNETWLSNNGGNALLFGTILQGYIYLKGDQDVVKMYQESFGTAVADLKLIAEGRNRKDTYRQPDRRVPV